MREILLTGGLGFIGRNLLFKLLNENFKINILVRPGTPIPKSLSIMSVIPIYVNLEDGIELHSKVARLNFDSVFHIGAVRGGRNLSREVYRKVNIDATEILAECALKKSAKFIFCSSVGVFGAIPKELPPNENTERQNDNYYHYTKIEAESRLQKMAKEGLSVVIIRPSITYGIGDFGFPYSLIRLVDKGIFLNCFSPVKINMVDVDTLVDAFLNASRFTVNNGATYTISDKISVELKALVDFISHKLRNTRYPKTKTLPTFIFRMGEFTFDKILKNELWKSRIQLISKSWYYDPQPAIEDLKISPKNTIPNFNYVIDWYKKTRID